MTNEHSVHSQNQSMTCKDVSEFLMAYLDNELSADQRNNFDDHLGVCSSCVRYLEQYKRTIRLGQAAHPPPEAPAAGYIPAGLIDAINAARKSQK